MLYPKNNDKALSDELFREPTSEYRGAPFWAWNGALERGRLADEIDMLHKMGFGGFHMHVRTGMDTPYLSEEYMDYIRFCTDKAKRDGLLSWLYDEDRWPSGTCGGKVTAEHPEYAKKQLLFTRTPYAPDRPNLPEGSVAWNGGCGRRYDNGTLLGVYDVRLNADGSLDFWRRVEMDAAPDAAAARWYAYLESATDDPWHNDHPYVDTLNPGAVRAFLDSTHEKYAAAVGDEFGATVPAIFTDEPQFTHKGSFAFPESDADVFIPWTTALAESYRAEFGTDVLDDLPCVFWEHEKSHTVRWRYQNTLARLFTASYCAQIGAWCVSHGLKLTGHVNGEQTLYTQTGNVGDAMRCYPEFGIPGIDMLCDNHEYNTAKQCQSIVRQQGKEGMLSELYGVTGWDYDFRGYKLQGDWQAALGVTVRVPHLTWMTMKGEAKRDYPASIGYQSPWWDQFSLVENHFARLNTALTRGRAVAKVAVIHPIESYWMLWGPASTTAADRDRLDRQFAMLTETLLFGQIDFDFLCEEMLPAQCGEGGNPLKVGEMQYDTVLVPDCLTLRSTTRARLKQFAQAGGRLIFLGNCPRYEDGTPSAAMKPLYDSARHVAFEGTAILNALEPDRFIDIRMPDGRRADRLLYQLRRDGDSMWLFITNGRNPVSHDVDPAPELRIALNGAYALTEYDTLSGAICPFEAEVSGGKTVFRVKWYNHSSLLLKLDKPSREAVAQAPVTAGPATPVSVPALADYTLDEPNMYLLDMAEWALDDGAWQPEEELLRLDNIARDTLGIPRRQKAVVQPYLLRQETPAHALRLRFRIPSELQVDACKLALEDREHTQVILNGKPVNTAPDGWFVDKDIVTIPLGSLRKGENLLELTVPIGRRTNIECCYLLGNFGVRVNGSVKTLTELPAKLGFGDIVPQGFPFYTGNLRYSFEVTAGNHGLSVRVPHYRGALIRVQVDGEDRGAIVFSPYTLTLTDVAPGAHRITLVLYGNRQNGFGQLHHTPGIYFYQSPDSWRSAGDLWRYEYSFKPLGILKRPEINI